MQNSQAASFFPDSLIEKIFVSEISSEQIWKSLYSRSFTIFYQCQVCDNLLDIDGWFFHFDPVHCPKCGTVYTGIFGKVLTVNSFSQESNIKNLIHMESFEGQEMDVNLPVSCNELNQKIDHIILILFSKLSDKKSNPWCFFDWSDKNTSVRYFTNKIDHQPSSKNKSVEKRTNNAIPSILVGLIVLLGLSGLGFFLTSTFNFF